jgi:hypothetical protein
LSRHCHLGVALSRSGSSGVDVGADEGLAEDGDEAALGLLTFAGAGVDEFVNIGGCDGGCDVVSNYGFQEIGKDVRVAQSKLARFRTSVAQQTGVPEEQRPTWRSSRGAAKATVAKATMVAMVNCILMVGWLSFLGKEDEVMVVMVVLSC